MTSRAFAFAIPFALIAFACSDDGTNSSTSEDAASATETSAGTDATGSESSTSVGDGDGDTTGDGDGDTTTGDGDGDSSGDGDGDTTGDGDGDMSGDGDGDTTGDGDGDTTSGDGDGDTTTGDGDGDPQPIFGEWLLTSDVIDDGVRLLRIDLSEGQVGQTSVICSDITLPQGVPQLRFTSLAFLDNILYAVRGNFLMTVDPCGCDAALVGTFPNGYSIAGIAVNSDDLMYAIEAGNNALIEIDPNDASTQVITNFNFDVGNHGLTWSNAELNELYFIEANTDTLRVLDGSDPSIEKSQANLSFDFTSVGAEMHPGDEVLYACSGTDELYSIDIQSGQVDVVAPMQGFSPPCGAIGAPWGPVECIPQ